MKKPHKIIINNHIRQLWLSIIIPWFSAAAHFFVSGDFSTFFAEIWRERYLIMWQKEKMSGNLHFLLLLKVMSIFVKKMHVLLTLSV